MVNSLGFGSAFWVQILVLTLTSCLNTGKLLNAPSLFFLRPEMGKNKYLSHKVAIRIKGNNIYKVIGIMPGKE